MPRYFHVARDGLRVGDIIQPGSWGSLTRAFGPGGQAIASQSDATNLIWEAAVESVRSQSFPTKVSRFDCVFACQSEQEARQFLQRFRSNGSHRIYEVELVDPATPTSIGDFAAITDAPPAPYVERAVHVSAGYWKDGCPTFPEVLIGGPVRVLQVI
jgi:hypothetical protein